MAYLLLFLSLALNFVISWSNASYVGRYWSESKQVGGSFRVYMVTGYIMAIAGFTMVYGYILLLISPYILPLLNVSQETIIAIQTLSADLIYLFCVVTMIPTGFYIWIRSLKTFFEEKTLSTGLTAGWNTFAQIHNVVNAAREAPNAFSRIVEALLGKGKKKNDKTIIVALAILIFVVAIFGGYFTASYIMKKADEEYDMFSELEATHPELREK